MDKVGPDVRLGVIGDEILTHNYIQNEGLLLARNRCYIYYMKFMSKCNNQI